MSPTVARRIAALQKVANDQAATLAKISKRKAARRKKKDSEKQSRLLKRTGGGGVAPTAVRVRKIGEDGNEESDDESGRGNKGGEEEEDDAGGSAPPEIIRVTKKGNNGNEEESSVLEEDFYAAEEFMWQTKSEKVGKLRLRWNTNREEYARVKPVLIDVPEDTLRLIWTMYGKTPSVVSYIEKVASDNYLNKRVVEGFTTLKEYAEARGWAEEATDVQIPKLETKIGLKKTPPPSRQQDPSSLQNALGWVRGPGELAEAAVATAVTTKVPTPTPKRTKEAKTAAPTATTTIQPSPKTPPKRVKPSVTIEATPEKACSDPEKHKWEPQPGGAYVKSGRLGGLSCIGRCGRKFVSAKPVDDTARGKEFYPSAQHPAQLCRNCSRGMCFDCHLAIIDANPDGGRRNTRRRGAP